MLNSLVTIMIVKTILLPVALVFLSTCLIDFLGTKKREVHSLGQGSLGSSRLPSVDVSFRAGALSAPLSAPLYLLLWLPAFSWVTQRIALVPNTSTDWLPIYCLATAAAVLLVGRWQFTKWWLIALSAAVAVVMAWPLLSYNFTWLSHGWVIAEILFWLCIIAALYSAYFSGAIKNVNGFLLLVVNGCLGLVVILYSSLLLGLLVCAYSSLFFLAGFADIFSLLRPIKKRVATPSFSLHRFKITTEQSHCLWAFTALFLVVSRLYVQIPWLQTFLILGAIGLPVLIRGRDVWQLVSCMLCASTALGLTVLDQVIRAPAYSY